MLMLHLYLVVGWIKECWIRNRDIITSPGKTSLYFSLLSIFFVCRCIICYMCMHIGKNLFLSYLQKHRPDIRQSQSLDLWSCYPVLIL